MGQCQNLDTSLGVARQSFPRPDLHECPSPSHFEGGRAGDTRSEVTPATVGDLVPAAMAPRLTHSPMTSEPRRRRWTEPSLEHPTLSARCRSHHQEFVCATAGAGLGCTVLMKKDLAQGLVRSALLWSQVEGQDRP